MSRRIVNPPTSFLNSATYTFKKTSANAYFYIP